jgi:hypothetical protein
MSHSLWTACWKNNLPPNQLFFLDCCRHHISPGKLINVDAEKMVAEACGFLDSNGNLTEKAITVLDSMEGDVKKKKTKNIQDILGQDYLDKIKEYREYFPGQRLSHGELARQSVNELKEKFVWFFKTYTDYDWDIVLDAAKYYTIIKERENYQFMTTSSYFIKKSDPRTKETSSKLADFCQLILDNPEVLLTL